MMLIEVQNEAIEFKRVLDQSREQFDALGQRAVSQNVKYRLVRYGQEMTNLRDAIVAAGSSQLENDLQHWQSVYDSLEVHFSHLRGMIDFAEVQYSKGIQGETSLLNRIFLVGVMAQLVALFSITLRDIAANYLISGLLIVLSIIPPLALYYLFRKIQEHRDQKRRLAQIMSDQGVHLS
jgi:hypothetical protein